MHLEAFHSREYTTRWCFFFGSLYKEAYKGLYVKQWMSTNDEYKENNFIKYLFQWSSCLFFINSLNLFTAKIDFIDYEVPNVSKMYYEGKDSTIVQKGCSAHLLDIRLIPFPSIEPNKHDAL